MGRFGSWSGRILNVLCTLVAIHTIDGYPFNESPEFHHSRIPRSAADNVQDGPVPECRNTTFCVDTPYYPSEYVDNVLKMNDTFKYLATVDVPSKLLTRESNDEESLCPSTEVVIRPKTALSIEDRWHYIVYNEVLMQTVRVEICKSGRSACKIVNNFAVGYTTTCKQSYIYRQTLLRNSD